MGALDMGLAPGLLPGRQGSGEVPQGWVQVPPGGGMDTEEVFRRAALGGIDTIIFLGADPMTDFPDGSLVEKALQKVQTIISVEALLNYTSTGADIVFPAAATATEVNGSFTNIEGRVSPISQKVTPPGTARPDWMIAAELAAQMGEDLGFVDVDEIWAELSAVSPLHADLSPSVIHEADAEGVLLAGSSINLGNAPESQRAAATEEGLELVVTRKMYDGGTILNFCPSLQELAAGAHANIHPATLEQLGIDAGSEVTVRSDEGEVSLEAVADAGVVEGTVAIEFNQSNASAARLLDASRIVTKVTVEAAT